MYALVHFLHKSLSCWFTCFISWPCWLLSHNLVSFCRWTSTLIQSTTVHCDILHLPPSISPPFGRLLLILTHHPVSLLTHHQWLSLVGSLLALTVHAHYALLCCVFAALSTLSLASLCFLHINHKQWLSDISWLPLNCAYALCTQGSGAYECDPRLHVHQTDINYMFFA